MGGEGRPASASALASGVAKGEGAKGGAARGVAGVGLEPLGSMQGMGGGSGASGWVPAALGACAALTVVWRAVMGSVVAVVGVRGALALVAAAATAAGGVGAMLWREAGRLEEGMPRRRPPPGTRFADLERVVREDAVPHLLLLPDGPHAGPSVSLSVVVPAYNEEERLVPMLNECVAYLEDRRRASLSGAEAVGDGPASPTARGRKELTYEVVVVDDGSSDATVETALRYERRGSMSGELRVLRLPRNGGKGAAVQAGMLCARGERLLMCDADGATDFSCLGRLERALEEAEARAGPAGAGAVVYGSRAHLQQQAAVKRTALRNALMHGFHLLVGSVVGFKIRDTQCGFKLFSRRAARLIFPNQRLRRWCFDVEVLALARALGVATAETPVAWVEIAGSKIRPSSILHMAFELALVKLAYSTGLWRVHRHVEPN